MKKEDVLKIKKCVEILNTLTQYWENDTVIIPHEMGMKECVWSDPLAPDTKIG